MRSIQNFINVIHGFGPDSAGEFLTQHRGVDAIMSQDPTSRKWLQRALNGGNAMAWTTPVIVEVCVGMEVTSYSSAEI